MKFLVFVPELLYTVPIGKGRFLFGSVARLGNWIADLLQHGLLTASFIPDKAQRELRELVGYRKSLV